jgi:hypothetical protein
MVDHTCNPNYMGDREWEGCSLRTAQEKVLVRPTLKNRLSKVVHSCHYS